MDIVVKGRNVEVPEHYRAHVNEKLTRLERYDRKVTRYEVELRHEPNPRQAKSCQRVEITGKGRRKPLRAESCAGDFYAALDAAVSKLESRLRKLHDRRVHSGRRQAESVGEVTAGATVAENAAANGQPQRAATAVLEAPQTAEGEWSADGNGAVSADVDVPRQRWEDEIVEHRPGRIVREKQHSAEPMSVDDALSEMELVGHDFYLFNDSDAGRPSVVYRRRGFDYGVIRLG